MPEVAAARARGRPRPGLLLCGGILALLAGCGATRDGVQETIYVFGTTVVIDIVDAEPARAHAAIAAAAAELQQLQREWHAWEPSTLTALNGQLAAGERVEVPASIGELIARSRPLALRSDGLFNPAVGRLMQMWGFHTSDFPITTPAPSDQALEGWRRDVPTLFDLVEHGEHVYSRNPQLQLDFGAVAEGMAAERVATLLREADISNALVSLGGDVYALGSNRGRPWMVGIRDPFDAADGAFAAVQLADGEALFTTGNYARFREAPSGARWPHVLDPRSGLPSRGVATVSVLSDDPVLADAAVTALMVAGPARFAELLNRLGVRCALLMTEQNELMVTAAMSQRLQLVRPPIPLGPPLGAPGPCSD